MRKYVINALYILTVLPTPYQRDVDEANAVNAEEVELVEDVLVNRRNGLLIFVEYEANQGTYNHADEKHDHFKSELHCLKKQIALKLKIITLLPQTQF